MAFTGDDPSYMLRYNVHLFIADLLLGYQPWLNTETVCTFPEPWRKKLNSPDSRQRTDIAAQRDLSAYEGTYGNKAYGQLEVYINETMNKLIFKFGIGQFILHPKSTKDYFYAQGFGLMSNVRDFSSFYFVYSNGTVSALVVPSFEPKDPPVFSLIHRDRQRRATNTGTGSSAKSMVIISHIIIMTTVICRCF